MAHGEHSEVVRCATQHEGIVSAYLKRITQDRFVVPRYHRIITSCVGHNTVDVKHHHPRKNTRVCEPSYYQTRIVHKFSSQWNAVGGPTFKSCSCNSNVVSLRRVQPYLGCLALRRRHFTKTSALLFHSLFRHSQE